MQNLHLLIINFLFSLLDVVLIFEAITCESNNFTFSSGDLVGTRAGTNNIRESIDCISIQTRRWAFLILVWSRSADGVSCRSASGVLSDQ